ncbi:cell elongation protein CozEb [Lentibacillus halophilus]|uniref:Cell elongation protein CozEb n=1 Tax=Lentibacillus halophilus TaxID=295065 RepID=A0ABN0Z979_9BACI
MKISRFMQFIGGRDLFFGLVLILLLGVIVFIYTKVSFIFDPILTIGSTVIPPLILAFIAYYLLNPIVNLLERAHIDRIWGIVILILGISGLFTGVILLTAPAIETQVKDLASNFPSYLNQMGAGIDNWIQQSFLAPYYEQGYDWFTSNLSNLTNKVMEYIGGAVEGVQNIANVITRIIVALVTFPFILFFLLKDGDHFKAFCLKLLPPRYRDGADEILRNMDVQVGSYIQGQIIVASCIGVLLYIGYLIIGLDYAITLAVVAAVTSVVPYLGPMIAISPAIIIALVQSPVMVLKLGIVWAAVQFLEGNFVSPNVMGKTMHVHPLTIIIVLLVAGNLFGVVGVILGIPGYAILKVIAVHAFKRFKIRYNRFYGDEYDPYEET